jgi:hypothetical protein
MSISTPAKQNASNATNVFEQVPSDIFNKLSSSLLELTTVQREFAVVKDQLTQAKVELEVILTILKKIIDLKYHAFFYLSLQWSIIILI